MSRQLRLKLDRPPSHRREDFVVSPANAEAAGIVDAWPRWHGGALALVGPEGSGKTHLGRIWAEATGALELGADARLVDLAEIGGRTVFLDDAEHAPSELLFHLINLAAEPGGGLLMTARSLPARWPCALPDLRSRLNALQVAELGPPDDELLEGVLQKFFRERNIRPADDVLPYLVRRMERSVPVAFDLVQRLDEASGAEHRPVSRALARQILEAEPEPGDLFGSSLAESSSARDNG